MAALRDIYTCPFLMVVTLLTRTLVVHVCVSGYVLTERIACKSLHTPLPLPLPCGFQYLRATVAAQPV